MIKIKTYLYIAFCVLFVFTSCNEESSDYDIDCIYSCKEEYKDSGSLQIKLTLNNDNPNVLITIYEGEYQLTDSLNNWITDSLVDTSPFFIELPVNKTYSVKAVYNWDNKQLNVIDGTKLKNNKINKDVCNRECWTISGSYIDVTLKHD